MRARTPLLSAAVATTLALSACASSAVSSDTAPVPAPPPGRLDPVQTGPGPTEAVVAAADAFLAGLSPEQRDQVLYDATDPALRGWSYFPTTRDRNGVAFGDLTDEQRAAALGVAEAVLSDSGYTQLRGVIAAEDALGVRTTTAASAPPATSSRSSASPVLPNGSRSRSTGTTSPSTRRSTTAGSAPRRPSPASTRWTSRRPVSGSGRC